MKLPLILASAVTGLMALLTTTPASLPSDTYTYTDTDTDTDAACPRIEEPKYIGVKKCKTCHFKQWKSWKKTPMAKAFKTLKPGEKADKKKTFGLDPNKDYTKDPECVECHVTGYGKPGGYPEIVPGTDWTPEQVKQAKKMENGQCEVCHGPGSLTAPFKKENEKYKKADVLNLGMIEPKKEVCDTCHNERSPSLTKESHLDFDNVIKDPKKIHAHSPLKHPH